jgi:hypothetical protein
MMTVTLEQTAISVIDLAKDVDLVGLIRLENEQAAGSRLCWALFTDQVSLVVGVGGDRGVLGWCGPDAPGGMEVSSGETDDGEADYLLGGLYPQPFPPACEIPIEHVYAAIAEFLRTADRPASVRWRPEEEAWAS